PGRGGGAAHAGTARGDAGLYGGTGATGGEERRGAAGRHAAGTDPAAAGSPAHDGPDRDARPFRLARRGAAASVRIAAHDEQSPDRPAAAAGPAERRDAPADGQAWRTGAAPAATDGADVQPRPGA